MEKQLWIGGKYIPTDTYQSLTSSYSGDETDIPPAPVSQVKTRQASKNGFKCTPKSLRLFVKKIDENKDKNKDKN